MALLNTKFINEFVFTGNLSSNLFLESKDSPISPDLSHLHSQLLGFQINPLSHIPLFHLF